jgi:hypothetical protein
MTIASPDQQQGIVDFRRAPASRAPTALAFALFALVALKLWITRVMTVSAIGASPHDDHLFLSQAAEILRGRWLGPYTNLTLAKGPLFPLFVAASAAARVPLLLAEQLLYVVACVTFVAALRSWVRLRWARVGTFVVLVFQPMTYSDEVATRTVREGIYPAITVLVLATAVGALGALDRGRPARVAWAAGFGLALPAFLLTREESPWLTPSLLLCLGLLLVRRPVRWRTFATTVSIAAAIACAVMATVSTVNRVRYGTFIVNEFRDGSFSEAMGALSRVEHARFSRFVRVPAEARARIYAVSPRFAELRQYLEGENGRAWMQNACAGGGICDDIAGGWFMWAVRDAVQLAGYYGRGARAVESYYRALAHEVDAACADGRLACRRTGTSFLPRWHSEYATPLRQALLRAVSKLVLFDGFTPRAGPSTGSSEDLAFFRAMTHERLAPTSGTPRPPEPPVDRIRAAIITAIGWAYRVLTPPLGVVALLALGWSLVRDTRRRQISASTVVAATLLTALCARVGLLALVDVTSFPAVNRLYLAPAYPLLVAFVAVSVARVVEEWQRDLGRQGGT